MSVVIMFLLLLILLFDSTHNTNSYLLLSYLFLWTTYIITSIRVVIDVHNVLTIIALVIVVALHVSHPTDYYIVCITQYRWCVCCWIVWSKAQQNLSVLWMLFLLICEYNTLIVAVFVGVHNMKHVFILIALVVLNVFHDDG